VRESFAPYVDVEALRHYSASGADLRVALRYAPELLPEEVVQIVETLKLLLTPLTREQVKSPVDIATLLMLDMGYLQQEQFKVACLDTRNRLQKLHLVYQGSLNTAMIPVGEAFREPIKLNSASVIWAHNHPSGAPRSA
jgi:DNA repair protein RadC